MNNYPNVYPNHVNIINFIRGVEPRQPVDLLEPVRKQLSLVQKHRLRATWLLQYDALIDLKFTELLMLEADASQEIGVWFEVVEPLAEKAGIPWRGRYSWDWHADVGFSAGYKPREREKLADVVMEEFRAQFGHYPQSVGSWFIDAHLLGYLSDRYGIVASCNCKDQWGTDGYTLWGGYYNQAYYPSRLNGFMPAQTEDYQIPVPVFRMLGSDPIYQYDADVGGNGQKVITLEPVYSGAEGGGGIPDWVRWFFDVNFRPSQVSFGYAQVGQENSFGWEQMEAGLTDQVELLARKQAEGELSVETLAETGRWFRRQYPLTPASSICALTDWREEDRQSIWYYNRYYRINLMKSDGNLQIRDIHLFDERYEERYLRNVCDNRNCRYDTLPVIDSARWSDGLTKSGIYPIIFEADGKAVPAVVHSIEVDESVPGEMSVMVSLEEGEKLKIRCTERSILISSDSPNWGLRMAWANTGGMPDIKLETEGVRYVFNGHPYRLGLEGTLPTAVQKKHQGQMQDGDPANNIDLHPRDNEMKLLF